MELDTDRCRIGLTPPCGLLNFPRMQHWPAIVLSVLLYCFGTSTSALAADPPPIEVNTNNAAKQKTEALAKKLEDSAAVQTFQQYLGQDILGIGILAWQLVVVTIPTSVVAWVFSDFIEITIIE